MLDHQCSDPEIVRRNGRRLLAQLGEQAHAVVSRLLVGVERADSGRVQEPAQHPLVMTGLGPSENPARSSASVTNGR
jgi:hypothetical protein